MTAIERILRWLSKYEDRLNVVPCKRYNPDDLVEVSIQSELFTVRRIKRYIADLPPDDWQPIETAPDDGFPFDCFSPHIGRLTDVSITYARMCQATHWMRVKPPRTGSAG